MPQVRLSTSEPQVSQAVMSLILVVVWLYTSMLMGLFAFIRTDMVSQILLRMWVKIVEDDDLYIACHQILPVCTRGIIWHNHYVLSI